MPLFPPSRTLLTREEATAEIAEIVTREIEVRLSGTRFKGSLSDGSRFDLLATFTIPNPVTLSDVDIDWAGR